MKLNDVGLDKIALFGQPYHGLWKSGSISLPNSSSKTCPAPSNGGVVWLKVPGQPAVSRTNDELASDSAAGREWRNYGLISGGRYGASATLHGSPGEATVFFIDAAKATWQMKITWYWANAYMVVKLRRFMHIENPYTQVSWSSGINVTVYSAFADALSAGGTLMAVDQNSTGSEFVLGSVWLNTRTDYCNGLLKVTVSGTVDLAASNYGLTFGGTLIGGTYFDRGLRTNHSEVTGDASDISVQTWIEYFNGVATGVTTETTYKLTNGIVVQNDPAPTPSGLGYSWQQGALVRTFPSSQVISELVRSEADIPLWASYHNDNLKVLRCKVVYDQTKLDYPNEMIGYYSYGGAPFWEGSGTNYTSCEIVYKVDGVTLFSKKSTNNSAGTIYGGGANPLVPGVKNHQETPIVVSFNTFIGWMHDIQYPGTNPVYTVPVMFPLLVSGISWSTQCLAAVNRYGKTSVTWASDKVVAPSGTSQTTSIDVDNLNASWQPVLDQIAVDSVKVCWF